MIKGITVNSNQLRLKVKSLSGYVRKEGFPIAANVAKQVILENTSRGMSPDGTMYAPLTDAYGKKKEKLVGNRNPDLRLSGDMLGSLYYSPSQQMLTVADDQNKNGKGKAKGVSNRRRFLIVSADMVTRTRFALQNSLQRFINR